MIMTKVHSVDLFLSSSFYKMIKIVGMIDTCWGGKCFFFSLSPSLAVLMMTEQMDLLSIQIER